MFARTRFPNFLGPSVPLPFLTNLDQWDGYAPQRRRLLEAIAARHVANPIVISGDIHSTWFNDLALDPDDPHAAPVASEFVSNSFRRPLKAANPVLNPRTRYFDGSRRGYLRMHVTGERWLTEARTVRQHREPDVAGVDDRLLRGGGRHAGHRPRLTLRLTRAPQAGGGGVSVGGRAAGLVATAGVEVVLARHEDLAAEVQTTTPSWV